MNYCSLDDAFQSPQGGVPQPGCTDDEASRQARKEERRKTRKSKILPMGSYVDPSKDPDRQNLNPLPDVPAMKPYSFDSFDSYNKASRHSKGQKNPYPPTKSQYDKDPLDEYCKAEYENHYMTIPVNGNTVTASKRFFGAQGPTDEPYADYTPDGGNLLQPDFTKAFQQDAGTSRAGTSSELPPPQMDMYWKPLTPSGVETSILPSIASAFSASASSSYPSVTARRTGSMSREHLPPHHSIRSSYEKGEISMEDVMKKLDKLFTKLDDMNHSTPEQLTSEMLMFISSGVFVLFLMDLLVKRGGSMRF
jgi:hypothetical protein